MTLAVQELILFVWYWRSGVLIANDACCILAMSSTDPEVIKMVGKFVNAIFSLRECI